MSASGPGAECRNAGASGEESKSIMRDHHDTNCVTDRAIRLQGLDPESLAEWYGDVLGVQWEDPADDPIVGFLRAPSGIVRFELSMEPISPDHHNLAIHVDDFRGTLSRLRGTSSRFREIPSCGHRQAVFEDPEGNRITIWGT